MTAPPIHDPAPQRRHISNTERARLFTLHKGVCHLPTDQIDHINGDRDDNRLANLRVVSNAENCRNRAASGRNASGVVGVSPYAFGRAPQWVSRIRVAGRLIHLGYFGEFDEAVAARRAAEETYGFHPNHGRSKAPMRSTKPRRREA